jgi:enoyl-CoA hydratase/carnithine racemase
MTTDPVSVKITGGVAVVTVDRPPVNAMSVTVLAALWEAAERLAKQAEVLPSCSSARGTRPFSRVPISASSQNFAQGRMASQGTVGLARSVFDAWHALPQPLIAAVQASAVGGGLALAPVCDF